MNIPQKPSVIMCTTSLRYTYDLLLSKGVWDRLHSRYCFISTHLFLLQRRRPAG